jgi:transcription initiation factor TFIIIB Brf1 subunit/transcription initiation factor TFIIB
MLKCPVCSGLPVSPEGPKGEKVCTTCGLVIDHSHNLLMFTQWTPEWHSNWSPDDPEPLKEWLTTLRTVSCQLQIPRFPFQEEAAIKIRKEKNLFLKSQRFAKKKRITIVALIHLILKEYNKNRSINQMCQELNIDTRLVLKQVWILKKINNKKNIIKTNRKKSKDYLLEHAYQITNNTETLDLSKKILRKLQKMGGNPISMAAGALYYSCKITKNHISKRLIGEVFHISPRTVDTNERKIRNIMLIEHGQQRNIAL